jgi:predicted nucleic acid-binding protein
MKRCTLDTNIITAFLKKELKVVKRVSDYLEFFDRLSIDVISYYEILRGLKDLGDEEKLRGFEGFIQENELVSIFKPPISNYERERRKTWN